MGLLEHAGRTGRVGFVVSGTCAGRGQAAPLAKSETCTVIVGFKPTTTGAKSVTLTTVTNGPAFTTGAITGFGRRLAAVSLLEDFGGRTVGTSAKRTLRITRRGREDFRWARSRSPRSGSRGPTAAGPRPSPRGRPATSR